MTNVTIGIKDKYEDCVFCFSSTALMAKTSISECCSERPIHVCANCINEAASTVQLLTIKYSQYINWDDATRATYKINNPEDGKLLDQMLANELLSELDR